MEEFAGRRWRKSATNLSFRAAIMKEERRRKGCITQRERERGERGERVPGEGVAGR